MSSLAEVSTLLVEQNTVLAMQADATMNTNKNIKKLTDYFTGLDALEKGREASPAISAPSAPGVDEGRPNADMSRFSIGALLSPAALLGIAKTFSKRLLGGGLLVVLADEIADAIGGEFKGELERAIVGLGIGALFGLKFGIAGAVAGALLDKETLDEITPIIQDIGKAVKEFADEYLPSMETIQNGIITGLEGLRNILTGDIMKVWEEGQVTETLVLLGAIGAIFAPGKALAAAIGTTKLAWAGIVGTVKSLGGLAGLVGTAVGGSAAAGAAGATAGAALAGGSRLAAMNAIPDNVLQREGLRRAADGAIINSKGQPISNSRVSQLSKNASRLSVLGRGAAAVLMGPAGIIIGAATLGFFGAQAFMTTSLYKDIKEKADALGAAFDGEATGMEHASLSEASMASMNPAERAMADVSQSMAMSRYMNDNQLTSEISRFQNRERAINNNIMNAPVTNTASTVNNQTVSQQSGPTVNLKDQVKASRTAGRH